CPPYTTNTLSSLDKLAFITYSAVNYGHKSLVELMAYILTDRDIEKGFWYYRPDEGFPPGYIQDPEEYDGLPALNVVCTQTGLPSHKQANLVKQWCVVLPTLVDL